MSNNFYDILGVDKNASNEDIKKAYRKKAMQYHPDRNSGDKSAEEMFKKINSAYDTLGDEKKRKQYDMFGSTSGNQFGGGGGGNPFGGGFSGFEDIFGGGNSRAGNSGFEFNIEDLFGGMGGNTRRKTSYKEEPKKEESLDFEKTYEIPIFDLILGCKIEVTGVYGQKANLKIPKNTKPGVKFRVADFGKSEGGKKGNLIVKVEAKMPKSISDVDLQMLSVIRENVGY
ncbi:MAG: DnaJ domain-containing protein [Candidatus Gracilibacteria bacterium]|nr:DnaJ domain-containing protein [Candidatus Gracilibacteria bacterium]